MSNFNVVTYYKIDTDTFNREKMYLFSKKKSETVTRNQVKEMNNHIHIEFEKTRTSLRPAAA